MIVVYVGAGVIVPVMKLSMTKFGVVATWPVGTTKKPAVLVTRASA